MPILIGLVKLYRELLRVCSQRRTAIMPVLQTRLRSDGLQARLRSEKTHCDADFNRARKIISRVIARLQSETHRDHARSADTSAVRRSAGTSAVREDALRCRF